MTEVGESLAQAAAENTIETYERIVPFVRGSRRSGEQLGIVCEVVIIVDEGEFDRIGEEILV